MFRTPQKTMLHFYNFVVLLTAVTVALGSTLEGTSSYYLITRQASTADGLFQVYRALDEAGCMSLCNNKDGCLKGVYSHKSGSCFLEMIDGCNHGRAKKRDKDVISTGGNSVLFTKLGDKFDLKEREFQKKPVGTCYPSTPLSCKEIYDTNRFAKSGIYFVYPDGVNGTRVEVYCHMAEIPGCGQGGWTLIMKIDGTKDTFRYNSPYWKRKESYKPSSALQGLDTNEALSPAYWTTPLTKLCLGMKTGTAVHWILVPFRHAQTLHSLIADGHYRNTNLNQKKWLSLMPDSSLEDFCVKEGFNPSLEKLTVRIGLVAGKKCKSPRLSLIGFGSTGNYSCGNFKGDGVSEMKGASSFGYILSQ